MSSNFKKSLNNNVISPYNKYATANERIAKVISVNKKKRTCDISYINIEGVNVVAKGIPVKKNSILSWFPKEGSKVEVQILGNTVRILNEYVPPDKQTEEVALDSDFFSNSINGTNGGILY